MPLFPAYASSDTLDIESDGETGVASSASAGTASPALEARLLASDEDVDADSVAAPRPVKRPSPTDDRDFYLDTKFDGANLPVTTLYYPGRPQYDLTCSWKVLGLDKIKGRQISRGKRKRYYSSEVPSDAAAVAAEVAARAQALRRALAADPTDQPLWLQYIAFQERWAGGEGALRAADEAEAAAAAAGGASAPLRAAMLRVRARHLPRAEYCAMLQRHIAAEKDTLALWVRLVRAVGGEGAGGADGGGAAALAARAMQRLRHSPLAYPHLLYAYGCWVRDAGLWELLTLLVELVVSVCFGVDARLPPPPQERLDARLQAAEDKPRQIVHCVSGDRSVTCNVFRSTLTNFSVSGFFFISWRCLEVIGLVGVREVRSISFALSLITSVRPGDITSEGGVT
ncbi:hypothetical protein K1T71_001551 [Dendrolimus kikuchii]|uniref:Uncharacterized protein n=1 Tax=Dendrolimus kikuchii TaxID=765133 RepID=A0ACC1DI89_9NEOP|nr:hypothetical protein K1T71_001551 [Dendrolimus kikuchii]